ncbi:MAG: hypothetical protein GY810_01040 [Aureispira sp.]|nr:hypothetical protein [Aureispira sp.]
MCYSSEFSWLPNSILKGVELPAIVYEELNNQNYGGYYTHGSKEIVVVTGEEELIPSAIAHEFCHYLQYNSGCIMHGSDFSAEDTTYEKAIHNYFSYDSIEFSALLFEYKHAKNYINEWWLRKLVLDL